MNIELYEIKSLDNIGKIGDDSKIDYYALKVVDNGVQFIGKYFVV